MGSAAFEVPAARDNRGTWNRPRVSSGTEAGFCVKYLPPMLLTAIFLIIFFSCECRQMSLGQVRDNACLCWELLLGSTLLSFIPYPVLVSEAPADATARSVENPSHHPAPKAGCPETAPQRLIWVIVQMSLHKAWVSFKRLKTHQIASISLQQFGQPSPLHHPC